MLNSAKNEVLKTVKEIGFTPDQFSLREYTAVFQDVQRTGFSITLRDTPLEFEIFASPDSYQAFDCRGTLFAPNWPWTDFWPPNGYSAINLILVKLREWIHNVVGPYLRERDVPDLWAAAQAESQLVVGSLDDPRAGTNFTTEEKKVLLMSLAQVRKDIIEEFHPTKQQLKEINQRLDYMAHALDRLNQFDWKSLMLSAIIGIATTMTLDTNSGARLLQIFKNAFSTAWHLLR